ncbi:LysR family transcriptional regulator [Myxococcus faecalis]|uniref:LysR family transcriptional regulator n=1 Tax=Myxococcus faecalis TaxID=3115646 RepID=UPI003CF23E26
MMRFDRLDPSHLHALQVLLEERHVTRAARRLGISQSSLSHRLRRLRESLGDPLLVRSGPGLVPTPRAEAIAPRLTEALRALEAAVSLPAAFDPATYSGALTLVMPDLFVPVLSNLLAALQRTAPALSLRARPLSPELPRLLAEGPLCLALAPSHFADATTHARLLAEPRFAVVGRRGHPALRQRLTLSRWLAHGHVVVHVGGERVNPLAELLARQGLRRHVALEAPSFLSGLQALAHSDLLMNVPMPLFADAIRALDLETCPPPIALPRVRFAMQWHERFQHDAAHRWVRDQVFSAVRPLLHKPGAAPGARAT